MGRKMEVLLHEAKTPIHVANTRMGRKRPPTQRLAAGAGALVVTGLAVSSLTTVLIMGGVVFGLAKVAKGDW